MEGEEVEGGWGAAEEDPGEGKDDEEVEDFEKESEKDDLGDERGAEEEEEELEDIVRLSE